MVMPFTARFLLDDEARILPQRGGRGRPPVGTQVEACRPDARVLGRR
ncbi:MAG: hypothetical protein IAE88_19285 [Rhodobacteraceae bacterium]|nr:hypothetical protein [Paracoccaceae bacterium]MCB1943689.1 hypothetical protein [Accumulibacter sp.]